MITFKTAVVFIIVIPVLAISPSYSAELITSKPLSNNLPNHISSHFVKVNGIRLHYIEMGKGPLVILLHGWPETSYSWRFTMQALSRQYRVVAPDLRGLGLSERTSSGYDKKTIATDIKDLIIALGETHANVVGHDMGGKAAYVMAHLYPSYVSKLVLVDCLIPGIENTDALHGGAWHYGFHMASEVPEMLTKGREKEYIRMQIKTWLYKKDAINEDTIDKYARHYATKGGMTAGFNYYRALPQDAEFVKTCARHGAVLGGESPLYAVEIGSTSLGKGVHREVESEGSR